MRKSSKNSSTTIVIICLPWVPWAKDEPETVDVKKAKIRTWKGEFYLDQKYTYGVFDKDDDHLIGIQYLFTRQGPGILEIGYVIGQEDAGKGYATQSSYCLMKLGFEEMKPDKMVIIYSPLNIASMKIPEKLGFYKESEETIPERYENGDRIVLATHALFPEQYQRIEKYEPVTFVKFEGW